VKNQHYLDSVSDSKRHLYLIWVVIAAMVIFYSVTIREGHNWNGDFAQFVHHAKNISEGKDYQEIHYIVNPYNWVSPNIYPPVVPALLAPIYYLFGLNLTAMKLMMIACFATSLIVINKVYKSDLPAISLLILTIGVGFNPYFWDFKDRILSDFPYLLFSFLSLLLMQRSYVGERPVDNILIPVILGVVMYLAYGTREIGIILPLTVLAFEVIKYRRLTRSFVISTAIFSLLVFTQYNALQSDYYSSEVQQQLSSLETENTINWHSHFDLININIEHISHQAYGYLFFTRSFFFWPSENFLGSLLFYCTGLFSAFGFFITLTKRITVLEIYPVGYIAVLLLFSGEPRLRYLMPILPFLFYYALIGIQTFRLPGNRYIGKVVLPFILISISALYTYSLSTADFDPIKHGPKTRYSTEMFNFISNTTLAEDTIIFLKPRILSLFTQRVSSIFPRQDDPDFLIRYLDTIEADYVISGEIDGEKDFVKYLVEQRSQFFSEVFQNEVFTVYRYETSKIP
jgi:4-amino-4-deoxy-L-arabinose transferase-like glycosyltransferase